MSTSEIVATTANDTVDSVDATYSFPRTFTQFMEDASLMEELLTDNEIPDIVDGEIRPVTAETIPPPESPRLSTVTSTNFTAFVNMADAFAERIPQMQLMIIQRLKEAFANLEFRRVQEVDSSTIVDGKSSTFDIVVDADRRTAYPVGQPYEPSDQKRLHQVLDIARVFVGKTTRQKIESRLDERHLDKSGKPYTVNFHSNQMCVLDEVSFTLKNEDHLPFKRLPRPGDLICGILETRRRETWFSRWAIVSEQFHRLYKLVMSLGTERLADVDDDIPMMMASTMMTTEGSSTPLTAAQTLQSAYSTHKLSSGNTLSINNCFRKWYIRMVDNNYEIDPAQVPIYHQVRSELADEFWSVHTYVFIGLFLEKGILPNTGNIPQNYTAQLDFERLADGRPLLMKRWDLSDNYVYRFLKYWTSSMDQSEATIRADEYLLSLLNEDAKRTLMDDDDDHRQFAMTAAF